MNLLVLGCGVSGLTCAIRCLEKGHRVTLWGKDLPPHTTSDIAAALWFPYKAFPEDKVAHWARRALETFEALARNPSTGVTMTRGTLNFREEIPDPFWRSTVKEFHRVPAEKQGDYRTIFAVHVPFIEMPIYLPYLVNRVRELGGRIEQKQVQGLEECLETFETVVNCTGLGARELAKDEEVFPIRGQVLRVSRPALSEFCLDEYHPDGMVYVFPRSEDCILGGTAEEHASSLTPDEAMAKAILERCTKVVPALKGCRVLEHKVGLRP